MVEICFAGVGEAFDETTGNMTVLLTAGAGSTTRQVLLDCGFTGAHAFWRHSGDPAGLDCVWISHFHGDHFLGLPLLLLRFREVGRSAPLTVAGPRGVRDTVEGALELAYPGFLGKLTFPMDFIETGPGPSFDLFDIRWSCAVTDHSVPSLAVRLDHRDGSVFYSGDGSPTPGSRQLAAGCDLIIHEAFALDEAPQGHGSVDGCIEFALAAGARSLALVHMNRDVRRSHLEQIRGRLSALEGMRAFVPDPGERVRLSRMPPPLP